MEDRQTLEKLAKNPNYKMSERQLAALHRLRSQDQIASVRVNKHDPSLKRSESHGTPQ